MGETTEIFERLSRIEQGVRNQTTVYNRLLTADEIAANHAVDKARFNLP